VFKDEEVAAWKHDYLWNAHNLVLPVSEGLHHCDIVLASNEGEVAIDCYIMIVTLMQQTPFSQYLRIYINKSDLQTEQQRIFELTNYQSYPQYKAAPADSTIFHPLSYRETAEEQPQTHCHARFGVGQIRRHRGRDRNRTGTTRCAVEPAAMANPVAAAARVDDYIRIPMLVHTRKQGMSRMNTPATRWASHRRSRPNQ
jgi:hypothetical protein